MFRLGDTVAFDPSSFNPKYWDKLSKEQKFMYYGELGYGSDKLKTFTFLTEMYPQAGHCVLVEIDTGKIHTMVHMSNLRLVGDEEC